MYNLETRSSRKKRVVALAVLALTLAGGFTFSNVAKADAAPVKDCIVEGPGAGKTGRITDPNSDITFKNIFWCQTQELAYVFPPTQDSKNVTPFGVLNAHDEAVTKAGEGNYIVCWSSSMSTKQSGGYYMMLTEGDAALEGQEDRFDIDANKADASADRFGWVSSKILGIKKGERPLNIDECGSAPVGSKVVDPTVKKKTNTTATAARQETTKSTPTRFASPSVDCSRFNDAPAATTRKTAGDEAYQAAECALDGAITHDRVRAYRDHVATLAS